MGELSPLLHRPPNGGAETAPAPLPAAPWRGRPRADDPRSACVHIRCTVAEHAALTAAAVQAGLSVGAYLRAMGLGSPGPRAVRRPPVERGELARVLGAIGRVGSNVNQLAHVANATGALPVLVELAAIRGEVRAMREALMQALGRKAVPESGAGW